LLWSVQQKSESIENIAAEASNVSIDHEKLTVRDAALLDTSRQRADRRLPVRAAGGVECEP
jgi:hypothetical protein